jgi:putative transposase
MRRGFLYLVAIIYRFSQKFLTRGLSNTMDADSASRRWMRQIARFGELEIFNTDQGSQFTSFGFTNTFLI